MHLLNPRLRYKPLLLVLIGVFSTILKAETSEPDLDELQKKGLVYVESTNVEFIQGQDGFVLKPYRERRGTWGVMFGIAYSAYEPVNYEPNFIASNYKDVYFTPFQPLFDAHLQVKRNFFAGSVGLEIAGGMFKNWHTDPSVITSTLSLTEAQVSLVYNMDTLFKEPYVVPYASAGAYMFMYKEFLNGQSVNGNTQPAALVTAGLSFQLDWIDNNAAREANRQASLQGTYLFAEGRKYFTSGNSKDPDLSNDLTWGGGLKVEF